MSQKLPAPLPPIEWDFSDVLKEDFRVLWEVRDWEFYREALREATTLAGAFKHYRNRCGRTHKQLLAAMLSGGGFTWRLPSSLCFASPEFPKNAALSIGLDVLRERVAKLPSFLPWHETRDHVEIARAAKKGTPLDSHEVHVGLHMVLDLDRIESGEWTRADLNTDTAEILAVRIDYTQTTELLMKKLGAIIEARRHEQFPDVKIVRAKGKNHRKNECKTDLLQLAAYRARKHYEPKLKQDWWKGAQRDGIYKGNRANQYQRPADAAAKSVQWHMKGLQPLVPS